MLTIRFLIKNLIDNGCCEKKKKLLSLEKKLSRDFH